MNERKTGIPSHVSTDTSNELAKTRLAKPETSIHATKKTQQTDHESDSTTAINIASGNSAAVAAETDGLKLGDTIKHRFTLVKELGRGGMGVVYKARDLRKEEARDRNPYIALKVLGDDFKKNPDSFIALQRETRKTQDLAHPNIVTVYDFDKDGDHVFMTMECLDGKPLSVLLREQYFQPKPLKERWQVIHQICSALAYAHKKNIIHLDLKPGNIYIKKDGTVKVLDFGIARAAKNLDNTETAQDTTVFDAGDLGALTPPYASCEMLENQDPDFRDDIYALACVAYEILGNHHPFNKIPATQARYNKISPSPIEGITKKQCKALMHGLAFNRQDRVPTIDQFLQEAQLVNPTNTGIEVTWKWMGAITLTLVFVSIAWQFYFKPSPVRGNTVNINEPLIPPTAVIPTPPPAKKVEPLTEAEIKKISRMLEIAEMHFLMGLRVEPKGTNALAAYQEVLSIDPQNIQAKKGIAEIVLFFEQQARSFWKKGDLKNTKKMLKKGFLASPKNKALMQLQKTIR